MEYLGCQDPLSAELWGITRGFDLAWEMGYRRVLVDTDSMTATKMIGKGCPRDHPSEMAVRRIKDLLNRNWDVKVTHCFRESNAVADHLAKKAIAEKVSYYGLVEPPGSILDKLQKESTASGVSRFESLES